MSNCDFGGSCTCRDCRTTYKNIICPKCGFKNCVNIESCVSGYDTDRKSGKSYPNLSISSKPIKDLKCYRCSFLIEKVGYYTEINIKECKYEIDKLRAIEEGRFCAKCNKLEIIDHILNTDISKLNDIDGILLCQECLSEKIKSETPNPSDANQKYIFDKKQMKWILDKININCKDCGKKFWIDIAEGWRKICMDCERKNKINHEINEIRNYKKELNLSIEEIRNNYGDEFISSYDVIRSNEKSYGLCEEENESNTHKFMREYGIKYFKDLGYNIYPHGIGIIGIYTFADFLAIRDGRIIFVECLTEKNITDKILGKKLQLLSHGELCIIIAGGTDSRLSVQKNSKIPNSIKDISEKIGILIYYYGNYRNQFKNDIVPLNNLPKHRFNIKKNENIRIKIEFIKKRTTFDTNLSFVTRPYLSEDENEYILKVLSRFISRLRGFDKDQIKDNNLNKIKGSWNGKLSNKSGLILSINEKRVVSFKTNSRIGIINIKGDFGKIIIENLLNFLKINFQIEYDENNYKLCIEKLSSNC